MKSNQQIELYFEEAYLKFALNCFDKLSGLSLDEFFRLENNLYESFLHSIDRKNLSPLKGKSA